MILENRTSSGTQNGRILLEEKLRNKRVIMKFMDAVSFSINQLKANECVMVKIVETAI